MPTISFAFVPDDIVYIKKDRLDKVCARHAYVRMSVKTFARWHNCNYYRLGDDEFYREDDLLSEVDYLASLAADDSKSLECLNRLLDNL